MSRFSIFTLLFLSSAICQAKDVTIDDVYQNFNMRSIKSSYSQRLKYYCQSYLSEYFTTQFITEKTTSQITLDNNDDVWTISIIGKNRISVANRIKNGTYNTIAEYDVVFKDESSDWQAKEPFIGIPTECVNFRPEKNS